MKRPIALTLVFLCAVSLGYTQERLEYERRVNGPMVTSAFEAQRQILQKVSAAIYDGRNLIAYGVILTPDGWMVTKASEIKNVQNFTVRVGEKKFSEVVLIAEDERWDLALIKVEAEGLEAADLSGSSDVKIGSWVVVNGATSLRRRRVLVGIVSAISREILPAGGPVLGVGLKAENLELTKIFRFGGASIAGLEVGDKLLEVDGEMLRKIEDLERSLEQKRVGDRVLVKVKREAKVLVFEVPIKSAEEVMSRPSQNDVMSGDYSKRRSSFPKVIQHDVLGNAASMGGPLLDLDGRVIGMNIAWANRAETFAIPVENIREITSQWIENFRQERQDLAK